VLPKSVKNRELMKKEGNLLIMTMMLCSFLSCHSKKEISFIKINQIKEIVIDSMVFPDDWVGRWHGELSVFKPRQKVQSIPMRLDILPVDTTNNNYYWSITYGEDTIAGKRAYNLIPIDKAAGHYIIDENNGIKIDGYLFDSEFVSVFDVMGNSIVASYQLVSDSTLQFEILMYGSDRYSISGDTIIDGEEVPPVGIYQSRVKQNALLRRD
jgi:hypothetical protein